MFQLDPDESRLFSRSPKNARAPRSTLVFAFLHSYVEPARIALGEKGLRWGIGAVIVGAVCFVVSCAEIGLSLETTDVDHHRQSAAEVSALDSSISLVLHSGLAMASGHLRPLDGYSTMLESWNQFRLSLDILCVRSGDSIPQVERLRHLCERRTEIYRELTPEIEAFNPPGQLFDRAKGQKLLALREETSALHVAAATAADRMVKKMSADYQWALWTLAASTAVFFGSGLTLLTLLGLTSTRYHHQWRKTRKARDLLRETLEALPAGVVLFDRDERLIMFNSAAVSSSPVLKRPGAIGAKYEKIAFETARLANEFGNPLIHTPEQWIARFRSKGTQRMRQPVGGRWFEWSEQLTASGRTVGLRVDITELKNHEIKLEAAQLRLEEEMGRLRSVVESSGASMVLTDRDLRILLVNREFASLHGLTVEEAVGQPLSDIAGIALDRLVLDKWLAGPLKPEDVEVTRYSKTKVGADGVPRIYNMTAKPVTDESGLVRQIVFLGVDDTERREVEKALADADRLATVGEMAATVVHEISQPLQVINLAAASALDEVAEAAARLGSRGDRVIACRSWNEANEALAIASSREQVPHIMASPVVLPDGDGISFYLATRRRFPNIRWNVTSPGRHSVTPKCDEPPPLPNTSSFDLQSFPTPQVGTSHIPN